jgi:hypothetical protein
MPAQRNQMRDALPPKDALHQPEKHGGRQQVAQDGRLAQRLQAPSDQRPGVRAEMGVDQHQAAAGGGIVGQFRRQLRHEDDGFGAQAVQAALVLRKRRLAQARAHPVDHMKGRPVVAAVEVAVADDP